MTDPSLHRTDERVATSPAPTHAMRIAVGIASAGRAALLTRTVAALRWQTRQPDVLIVCPATPADAEPSLGLECTYPVRRVTPARPGLTLQRNAILAAARDCDVIVFLDDDFIAHDQYLQGVEEGFAAARDVCAMTGRVVADGIHGQGNSISEAWSLLANVEPLTSPHMRETYGGYGCNMAFRMRSVLDAGARFDERLPLYGWQEDIDFSRQLSGQGRIVQFDALLGVHLGVKSGRQSGRRFGYSQIANPCYLATKGTMRPGYALKLMSRNVLANLGRLWRPEPHVDRVGRAVGNLLAFGDLLRGRLRPERILEL